jgi:hypothetical protein
LQTFLPYPSFEKSMKVLDNKRLGKQRVEAYTIIQVLSGDKKGWRNHPAVKMWDGYETALLHYMNTAIREWKKRKFKNKMLISSIDPSMLVYPHWFGNDAFHASHRSNLLRKFYSHYSQFGWKETDDLPYFWPDGLSQEISV